MNTHQHLVTFTTRPRATLDITSDVARVVAQSGIHTGLAHVFVQHASNWLVLKGTLGADKDKLLEQVRSAIASPANAHLRPAWARGL